MMEVEKPWEFKDEVDIMEAEEDDAAGALQTREIKTKMADLRLLNTNGDDLFKQAAAEEEDEEDQKQQSVFLDPTQVSDGASAEQEVTEVGGENENGHGTSSAEGKELEKRENVNAQETNHNSSNGKSENGSHSNGVHEASSSSETVTIADGEAGLKLVTNITKSANSLANWSGALDIPKSITDRTEVHEIEVEKDEHVTKGKVSIEEYDLEKILDEQETHDLYCPNCKSCITRRVILRKRKRTVRQPVRDEPPKKPQLEEPSANASNQTIAEGHDQESPDVFRCLSCFTFFIPTGCGFNLFRIFERRDVNQVQVQHPSAPHEMSDNCGSWLLSCFQTVDSPKKSADADPAKEALLSGQSIKDQTSLVQDNTSSAHCHATATIGKAEQLKKPLPSGSSSLLQTTNAKNEEESKHSFGEFHGTTSSSITVHTSSSTTTKINSWQSGTGVMHKEERHMVTGQPDFGRQEQIPLSNPVGDAAHMNRKDDIQENTTTASESSSFFSQEFFNSAVKFPAASTTNMCSEVSNMMGEKPTSDIPQAVRSEAPPHVALPIPVDVVPVPTPAQRDEWDVLKAIVYGGLVESITSLSVVSAAAASGAKTLDIFILGIANLIGGLPIIFHNIADMRNLGDANENDERVGQYWLQLGRRSKYQLHMVMAILSYILFGLLPPVAYGLSFRKDDNRENKMMVVAAASLACVALLAIGKAYVKRPRTYFTTLLYYLSIGLSSSGLSYVAGVLITRLLAHFGLIDQGGSAPTSAPAPPSLLFPDAMGAGATPWASY